MSRYFLHFMMMIAIAGFSKVYAKECLGGISGSDKLSCQDVFNAFPDGTANAQTKNNLPVACRKGTSSSWTSFIKSATPIVNHPSGSELFSDDATLGQLLTTFLTNLEKDTTTRNFTIYFTKIHLAVLHQLYMYLTKIYAVFNMTHIDTIQEYLTQDAKQALNKKTLIINHLINIIEAQSNGAIRARFPTLPPHLATYTGNMLMKHDYGADLSVMLEKSEEFLVTNTALQELIKPTVTTMRDSYLSLFADYLRFFNRYTQTLHQDDTSHGYVNINEFAKHALRIAQLLESKQVTDNPAFNTKEKVAWLRSLNKLNPPLFFYDAETMRGLKIIPALAKSLPKNVENVPWPAKIVEDAKSGTYYKPKFGPESNTQLAFFKGDRLYVNIPTMQYLYTQELLPQPNWLNSVEGVMKMLQACLGDFSVLVDPLFITEDILDPCMECIVRNASIKAGLLAATSDPSCNICQTFIDAIKTKLASEEVAPPPPLNPPSGAPGGGPGIPNGPPGGNFSVPGGKS